MDLSVYQAALQRAKCIFATKNHKSSDLFEHFMKNKDEKPSEVLQQY